jgi:hypothetical protein
MDIAIRGLIAISIAGSAFVGALGQLAPTSALTGDSHPAIPINMAAAGPNHPAKVPDGYVITPFGYFHPSCVQSLATGERLLADGRVQHADGTVADNVAFCSYPHYTPSGDAVSAATGNISTPSGNNKGENTFPEVVGWIENASITTGSSTKSYGALIALWTVPPQPTKNDGQTLYFFPGFEDINSVQSILQPVLGWFGGQWTIASWNCCLNNIVTTSPFVNVAVGDEIYGSITSACSPGTLSCATWNVLSLDMSTGESTTLGSTPSEGQVFNWAFGAVMEPYYVISCDDYPPNGRVTFNDVTVFDENLRPISDPKWNGTSNTTETPQCNYGVKSKLDEIALHY